MGLKREFAEDTVIIHEKEESRFMYLILKGTVAIYKDYGTPDEYLLGLFGVGKTFGEIGLLNHEPSMNTVVAVSDVTVAIYSEGELTKFFQHHPEQALGTLRSLTRMNKLLDVNLKMVLLESRKMAKYKELYSDALKSSNGITVDQAVLIKKILEKKKK